MAGLFEKQASIYAATRPTYPPALFSLLSSLTKNHKRAWDVGTGNGQAAVAVADYYEKVIVTDVSNQQLSYAQKRSNITYALTSSGLSRAEVTTLVGGEGTVDLVTVAQAVHWFDLDLFYSHVKHVLRKPGGVFAVWCYGMPKVNPEVDKVLLDFYSTTLPYWEPAAALVKERYKSLYFPFEPVLEDGSGTGPIIIDAPQETTMEGLLGFVKSWSALNTARERGVELLDDEIEKAFRNAWGSPHEIKTLSFDLHLRIGTASAL